MANNTKCFSDNGIEIACCFCNHMITEWLRYPFLHTAGVTDVNNECWLIISGLIISAKHIATVIVEEQGGADSSERRLWMLRDYTTQISYMENGCHFRWAVATTPVKSKSSGECWARLWERVSKPNRMTGISGNALWEEVRLPSGSDSQLQPQPGINSVL